MPSQLKTVKTERQLSSRGIRGEKKVKNKITETLYRELVKIKPEINEVQYKIG